MINSSLKTLAQMLANKEISSVELTQTFLNRIDAYNPVINAYIALDHEKTLAQAKAADVRIAAGTDQMIIEQTDTGSFDAFVAAYNSSTLCCDN